MEKRVLGRTGIRLSVIGFGGIVVKDVSPADASKYVARAIERGINYFDVAPSYGNAEERLGPALEPYRDEVFLACKTGQRLAKDVDEELHRSLKRLKPVSPSHVELLWLACDAVDNLARNAPALPDEAVLEGEPIFKSPK